jgi:hypothetical protein
MIKYLTSHHIYNIKERYSEYPISDYFGSTVVGHYTRGPQVGYPGRRTPWDDRDYPACSLVVGRPDVNQ